MNDFLLYLLHSTICLAVLYLLFRLVMRKEANSKLNRTILLFLVFSSLVIPQLVLPGSFHQPIEEKSLAFFTRSSEKVPEINSESIAMIPNPERISRGFHLSTVEIVLYGYTIGCLISLLMLIYSLFSLIALARKAEIKRMEGFRLFIVKKEIPAFSFGRMVFISLNDFTTHYEVISAHEQAHIRLNHFYDLIFLEGVKIFQWFNPFVYWLIRDMKDIHEFQADHYTLQEGVDATKYQLLIIEKGVGHQLFTLANSFNHCQIKNRIVMMNKQKNSKAGYWKVAIFLPVLVLLLFTFCKSGENLSAAKSSIVGTWQLVSYQYGTMDKPAKANYVATELITPTHFTWLHYGADNKVFSSAGGTYEFDGVNFTPNVEFGASDMLPYFGKSKYTLKFEGDQMFLSGYLISGLKIQEIWKKL